MVCAHKVLFELAHESVAFVDLGEQIQDLCTAFFVYEVVLNSKFNLTILKHGGK